MEFSAVNWPALGLGTVLAYGLGMLWFSPKMFGPAWSKGSHNIRPPDSPPAAAMTVTFIGTLLLAVAVGLTEAAGTTTPAIAAILAAAALVAGMDLFSQKTVRATLIDAGYILAGGGLMILSHCLL